MADENTGSAALARIDDDCVDVVVFTLSIVAPGGRGGHTVVAVAAGTARKPSQTRTQGARDPRRRERQTADGEGRVNVEAKRNNKHPPRTDEGDGPPPPSPISGHATTLPKPRRPIECVITL